MKNDTTREQQVRNHVAHEGEVCAHQLDAEERRIATRLVRRGVLRSHAGRGCRARHYTTTD